MLTFPSVYGLLLERIEKDQLASLQSVSVAGEACPAALVKQHHQQLPNVRLLNQYGPTEATVGATIYETSLDTISTKVPIGQAIDKVHIYLLDENKQEVATGETGEIYIGGKGVARAYLNRPQLTAERFLKDPFAQDTAAGCTNPAIWRAAFRMVSSTSSAEQTTKLKLRGYRIELGEIEATLLQHTNIQAAVVQLIGDRVEEKQLVAYVVWKEKKGAAMHQLRRFLAEQLPDICSLRVMSSWTNCRSIRPVKWNGMPCHFLVMSDRI